ncbi:hypothetical protein [uncultured Nonlabens sp.]|uniref:hypothetical protein n=1 Tax=uncultured Nonlabens sp. TaxID=859306 RepID=UPI002636F92A|nr:hypothetical protein [uncultured Nonlabens sp.]
MRFHYNLIACDSDDPPSQESLLPPITMTGENTFRCLIDGKFSRPLVGANIDTSGNRGIDMLITENVNAEIEVNHFNSHKKHRYLFIMKI